MAARPPLWDVSPPSRRGGACPSRRVLEFFGQRGGVPYGAARRVVAPYGRHGPRKAGGSGDPPLRGNFGPRRCDGRHSHETAPVLPELNRAIKNAVGAALCGRPSPVVGRSPVHPVGEGLAPPAGFRNFFGQRRGVRPAGRRAGSSRPTNVMVRGRRAGQETRPYEAISVLGDAIAAAATEGRPYGVSGKSQQNQTTGGASPSPTEWWGKHSAAENRRAAVRRSRPTYFLRGPQLKNRLEQPYNCSRRFSLFSNDDQYASFSSSQLFSSLMGTRTCSMVSRSRIVTALSAGVLSSPTVWKSTVMQ